MTTEDHDRGLSHDLPTLLGRRRALGLLSAGGMAFLAACGVSTSETSTATPSPQGEQGAGAAPGGADTSTSVGDGEIPEETNGPYPADGTNGTNVLTESGIVRSDIRSSFGSASGTAEGVLLTVSFTVVDVSSADDPGTAVAGAAVYAWQCDADGNYSMYSEAIKDENYLRGVQETDANGTVTFTSIFPGAYRGRWPHIHFEVYPTLADATSATNRLRTSQLAFPEDTCNEVYALDGYPGSAENMTQTPLDADTVFSDGYSLQMAKMSGTVDDGLVATLRVPI